MGEESTRSDDNSIPVITRNTSDDLVFADAADFDLELISSRTLDGRTQELVHLPTLRG
ncbi:hypothetical protein SAMN05414137_11929 [Streptacidiphilus jiangxiensis]|uniref:Uncharacterized protein n=1 Tax=Streptacidiphilus jiangxiensis TaxID=235985 RepID=A0A1H7VWS7_STRJI|nr:hypothetical protein SAMN05414137_11929 [Streptacidiphilus jiangxiensis]